MTGRLRVATVVMRLEGDIFCYSCTRGGGITVDCGGDGGRSWSGREVIYKRNATNKSNSKVKC